MKAKKKDFIKDFVDYVKNGDIKDEEVEYVEDCFEDMDRPKFGYKVQLMLKEQEPCQINFDNPEQSTCNLRSNDTREEQRRVDLEYSRYYAQSRQTGEEFRSSSPPECRIELCRSQTTLTATSTTTLLPTQPTTQPTQLTAQPTQSTTQPIQSTAQPTFLKNEEVVTQPTQPSVEPSQQTSQPTQPTNQPTQPTFQQTQRPTLEYFNSYNIDYYGYQKGPKNVY